MTVIAATNCLESLDKAVIRPGRLSKHIKISLPDESLRKKILDLYVKEVPMAPDVDLAKLAGETVGFSGAGLEDLVNEAKFHAVERISEEELENNSVQITMDDFNNVLEGLKSRDKQVSSNIEDISNLTRNISNLANSSKSAYAYGT